MLRIGGREVSISNPDKVYFPETGYTKLDLVQYYLAVADGALRGAGGRPMALKRFVDGAAGEAFFQKRAPDNRPDWIRTAELTFPSGRTADEIVLDEPAGLAWVANLGCIDLNPHPVRAEDLDHPDELRVDLDPVPGVTWSQIREVALVCREALEAVGLVGWPKTSGSRGIHINVRIEPRWTYPEVRRAALALARDVERRAPAIATSKWWKEERHGVFLDYNQNAKDRTVASAYSVRPLPDARVSTPLRWDEVADVEAEAFTLATVPARRTPSAATRAPGSTTPSGSLEALLELSAPRTRRRARATRRGRRTTRSRPASRRGSSRRRRAARRASTSRAAARRAGRRRRSPPSVPPPSPPATRTPGLPTEWAGPRGTPGIPADADRPAQDDDPGHRDLPRGDEGRGARGPRALEGAPSRGGRAPRAGRRPGRRDARPLVALVPRPGQPDPRPGGGPAGAGGARPGLRPVGRLRVAGPERPARAGAAQEADREGRCPCARRPATSSRPRPRSGPDLVDRLVVVGAIDPAPRRPLRRPRRAAWPSTRSSVR